MGSKAWKWTLCSALTATLVMGIVGADAAKKEFRTSEEKAAFLRAHPIQLKDAGVDPVKVVTPVGLTPDLVLYDQTSSPSATGNSATQNFEAVYDTYDCQGADDFDVPGSGWSVTNVVTPGAYSTTGHTAGVQPTSIHVTYYADAAGLPGAVICDLPTATFTESPVGTYTINAPCALSAGRRWVAVQPNLNFLGGGGQWFWTTRTVQSFNPSKWQNPGGGFGTSCATWANRATCLAQTEPDQIFQILGSIASCTVDADCADGNLCNGVETCQTGSCVPGTAVNCDDSLFCTTDGCTPATGVCTHVANTCTDGNPCTTDACDETNDVCVHSSFTHVCNTTSISIPNTPSVPFPGSPYPSNIVVSGLGTTASLCSVELNGVTHTFPDDIDIMLVGPAGGAQNRSIWSDAGGSGDIAAINVTLSDSAATALSDAGPLASGTFKPANYTSSPTDAWPAPAPAPTGISVLSSAFSGINPNGTWSLFVVDDSAGDTGSIAQGWCLNILVNSCTVDADCNDGNLCNGTETCLAGNCQPGTSINCDDSDACTTDGCTPATGVCTHAPVVCNDGNACTVDSCVSPTGCTTSPVSCDDANDCTTDTCAPATGCAHAASAGGPCNDGNSCTDGDTCQIPCSTDISENFDGVTAPALPAGWSTQLVTGQAGDAAWTTAVTAPSSVPNSGFTDDPNHVTDKVLNTPSIPIPAGTTQLTFKNRFQLEASAPSFFDGGVLEISINGGAFTDIVTAGGSFVTGGYTGAISTAFSSPIAGRQAWSGISGGGASPVYITTTANLPSSAAGQPVVLRWRVASDSSVAATGQWIDDVVLTTCSSICAGAPLGTPGEVLGDAFAPDKQTYSWSSTLFATRYDVVQGKLLPVGPGGGDEVCYSDVVGTSLIDPVTPAPSQLFFYVVRGDNGCGAPGTYGFQSNGSPRLTTTCP